MSEVKQEQNTFSEPTLKEKTAKGLFWGGINTIGQQVIQLCFGIFMARILTPSDYGMVGMLAIFTLIANLIQESGFSSALINKIKPTQVDYSSIFWFNTFISLLIYIVLFLLAENIAIFFNQPVLKDLAKVVFLSFVFNALGIVQNTVLTKRLEVNKLASVNLLSLILSSAIGLYMAFVGMMYWAIAIQTVSVSFFRTIILWTLSKWRPSFVFSLHSMKEMFPFSIKLLLSGLINQIAQNLYSILLGKYYDREEVGYYSQGNKWYNIPFSVVNGIISSIAFPVLSSVKEEPERQRLIFRKMVRFTAFISFPIILGFGFISEEIVRILITDKWINSVPIIQLLCIWGAFLPIHCLYSHVLISKEFVGINLIANTIYGVALIITLLLTVNYGIVMMIIANLIVNFSFLFSYIFITKYLLKFLISDFIKDVIPFLIMSILAFFVAYLVTQYLYDYNEIARVLLKIIISAIIYVMLLYVFRVVIFKELLMFLKTKIGV